jgi:hypothetical protein
MKQGIESPRFLWRTYNHEKGIESSKHKYKLLNPSPAHHEPLWQVARATSAAPFYFESIKIGERKFLDGGMGANNPALLALGEIRHKHRYSPALFVSIGAGVKHPLPKKKRMDEAREFFSSDRTDDVSRKQFIKKYLELGRLSKDLMTDTEGIMNDWLDACEGHGTPRRRFNVEHGLGIIPIDDWRPAETGAITLEQIRNRTEEYLSDEEVRRDLDFCAQQLVEIRHRRSRTERWEMFATDLEYYCPHPECLDGDGCHYRVRDELRQHWKYHHDEVLNSDPGNLEAFVSMGRCISGPRSKDYEKTADELKRATSTGISNGAAAGEPRRDTEQRH